MRETIFGALTGTVALVGVAMLFVETVPPHSITHGAMYMCNRRVLRYAHKHDRLPRSLNETEPIKGFNASIEDVWGVLLEYSVDTNDIVTFKSLGKDKKPGGLGKNADMTGLCHAKEPNGTWADGFEEWTRDPFEGLREGEPNKEPEATR